MSDERSVGIDGDAARTQVATGDDNVQIYVERAGSGKPAIRPGPYGLPMLPDGAFVGRDDELERLHQALAPARAAVALTPAAGSRRVAAHGGGGIGKTRLAIEYGWRHGDAFPGGVFFAVVGEREPVQVWAELGRQLFVRDFTEDADAAEALLGHLKADGERVLIVLDDVAGDAGRFASRFELRGRPVNALPQAERVSVVITTRVAGLPGARPFPVERLAGDDAVDLLSERSGRPLVGLSAAERQAAEALADEDLGGHALGVSLAGGYLGKVPSVGFAAYRAKLRDRGLTAVLEEAGRHAGYSITDHERSIAATFRLSHALLQGDEPENARARALLELASLLAPGVALDRGLLGRLLDRTGLGAAPEDVDLAVSRLVEVSLLSSDLKIHALVADYVRWSMDDASFTRCCNSALTAVNALFPDTWLDYWKILIPGIRSGWEPLTASREKHVSALLKQAVANSEQALLGLNAGDIWTIRGDLRRAATSYDRAREIYERLAEETPKDGGLVCQLSLSQERIGIVLQSEGDLPGALREYRAGFEIRKRLVDQDPDNAGWLRDLSVSHNKIGEVLQSQGDLTGALREYRAGFEIARRLAEQAPDNAGWLRDLSVSHERIGDVLKSQGDLTGALREYRAGFEIARRLAEQDPDNAGWQTDFAGSCWRVAHALDHATSTGRTEAIRLLEEALGILRRLDDAERLTPVWQEWLPKYQTALDQLRKK